MGCAPRLRAWGIRENMVILSHKVQNPLAANDHHTMAAVITHAFIDIIT
jgi:hypothetical protein